MSAPHWTKEQVLAAITIMSLPLIYTAPAKPLYNEQADQATK